MQRVIPGVSIAVIKEVVPKALRPAGVMGLIGIAGQGRYTPYHIDNWGGLKEEFGPGIAHTMPEARQALLNGIFELVIVRLDDTNNAPAVLEINDTEGNKALTLRARGCGAWGNKINVEVKENKVTTDDTTEVQSVDITLKYNEADETGESPKREEVKESFKGLVTDPDHRNYLPKILESSTLVTAEVHPKDDGSIKLPKETEKTPLAEGTDPDITKWQDAIAKLEGDADVDMVMASIPDSLYESDGNVDKINAEIKAHCEKMCDEAANRIGFGTVSSANNQMFDAVKEKSAILSSDRFVMIAPHGVAGAVAGRIASLPYYHSPTFKSLSGVTELEVDYSPPELRTLLGGNVLPVDLHKQRGFIVIKGITTSGEQISVTRVADHAVRGVKSIAPLFIGKLNTEDGRMTLKQKIVEFFIQMEKENAIVPKVDGTDPAFKVDVYSSPRDFALGNVRIDIAVRPVRAIDYIYVTIFVQA
jgi:hypothetical protein